MVVLLLWVVYIPTLILLLAACRKIEVLQERERLRVSADHDSNISRITQLVGDRHAAEVLRQAARDWDSPAEQANLTRLGRERYTAGGPSMPVIWLEDRAEQLDPLTDHDAWTLNGERA